MGRIFVYKSSIARRAVCTCVYIQIFFVHNDFVRNVGEPWKNIREFPAMGKNQNYWGDGGQILGGRGFIPPSPRDLQPCMLYEVCNKLSGVYNMLYEVYNMLFGVYNMLSDISVILTNY